MFLRLKCSRRSHRLGEEQYDNVDERDLEPLRRLSRCRYVADGSRKPEMLMVKRTEYAYCQEGVYLSICILSALTTNLKAPVECVW